MEFRGVYFTPEEVDAMRWLIEAEREMRQEQPEIPTQPSKYSAIPVPTDETLGRIELKLSIMPVPGRPSIRPNRGGGRNA